MEQSVPKRTAAEIARWLDTLLRVTREDEAKFRRILEMRRLRRLAKQAMTGK